MRTDDLKIFNEMPFLCWAKDDQGRYVWANPLVSELAGEDVTGKTDDDLVWADYANELRVADKQVWQTREPVFKQEYAEIPGRGKVTMNVCKWLDDLDGNRRVFGISFEIK